MPLPKEQTDQIKKQLIQQINSTFPEDKKQDAIQKIQLMNDKELEEFLIQNKFLKKDSEGKGQCLFCSIAKQEIASFKIGENEKAIAILEINPLSKGHSLIIPKEHLESIPSEAEELAKIIKEKIKKSLEPKDVLIEHGNLFGHAIINVIPTYGEELETERKKEDPEKLKELQEKINSIKLENLKETKEAKKEPEIFSEKDTILPKRIP